MGPRWSPPWRRTQPALTEPVEPTEPAAPAGPDGPDEPAWRVIGCSVRGASHVRSGLENQDAIEWFPPDGRGAEVVLSVADGHGSAKSFRSAIGSRLAVDLSRDFGYALLEAAPTLAELSLAKDRLERIPQRVVYEWRNRVQEHFTDFPFTEAELGGLAERDGQAAVDRVLGDPYLAYGSTLITAVAAESFMAFWQIGDGDVVTVSAAAEVGRPLPGDDRLMANETTSLCTQDAWRHFRVAIYGTPSPMILISSDGFANSFQDEAGFLRFGSDVQQIIVNEGLDAVDEKLAGWLEEMTRQGSGDDISLGLCCRRADLPPAMPGTAMSPDAQEAPTLPINERWSERP